MGVHVSLLMSNANLKQFSNGNTAHIEEVMTIFHETVKDNSNVLQMLISGGLISKRCHFLLGFFFFFFLLM